MAALRSIDSRSCATNPNPNPDPNPNPSPNPNANQERLHVRLLRGGGRGGVDGAVAQQLREELAHRLQQARVRRGQPPQQGGELRCARAERRLVGAEA